jgi:hypothetical protein
LPALKPGVYRLRYQTQDEFGATCHSQKEFIVAGQRTPLALPALLLAEHPSVTAGDKARFLVLSGFGSQPLWFELFRDGKLAKRQKLDAGSGPQLIEVPVTDADRGGFGVRLTLVRDHQFMSLQQALFVPWDDKELKLELASFRDKIRPGAHETWRVTVKRPEGKSGDGKERWTPEAGSAELLAYMYDRSLDIFAPHQPPQIGALYPLRSQVPGARANLGAAHTAYSIAAGWRNLPEYPPLVGDRFKFQDAYGRGGAGARRQMLMDAPMAGAPPPAPPPQAAPMPAAPVAAEAVPSRPDPGAGKEAKAVQAEAAPAPEVALRSNFAETAFWQPQLDRKSVV